MGQALGLILLIVGIAAVTAIIIYSMVMIMGKSNAAKILQYGRDREYFIYEMLSTAFVGGTVMRNLYFPVPTKEGVFDAEVDIVCVTRGGIAVIEVKGSKGVIDSPPEGRWCQRYGQKVLYFQNPYIQNEGHVTAVRRALESRGITNVPIRNYVVYTDRNVRFTHNYPWLLRSDQLVSAIERMNNKLILTRKDHRIIMSVMRHHRRRRHMTFKMKYRHQNQRRQRSR